jgi:protein-tyrosine phosphatase
MIDIHAHILPKIDDGADSLDTFFQMIDIASKDGIKTIIATPHFLEGRFENKFEDVKSSVETVLTMLKEKNLDINIIPGQEVMISQNLIKHFQNQLVQPIQNTNYMLLELPFNEIPSYTFDILYELKIRKITPIIAHPERYVEIIKNPSKINQFIEEGCLFQLNASSILGHHGKDIKKTAETLIKYNIIDFVASDSHDVKYRRPKIKESIEFIKQINIDIYNEILINTEKLIKNEKISSKAQKISTKKSFFDFFKRG